MIVTKSTTVEMLLTADDAFMVTASNKRVVTVYEVRWDISLDVAEVQGFWLGMATQEYVSLDEFPKKIRKILEDAR